MSRDVELSRLEVADEIGPKKRDVVIEADETERNALAIRFELLSLERLLATLSIVRSGKTNLVEIRGQLQAPYRQNCVVTLEPVALAVEEPIEAFFSDDDDEEENNAQIDVDIDVDHADAPERIQDNIIDLGELVAQQFAISMDPYPRAPGVEVPSEGLSFGAKIDESEENHPFAALRRLK